MLDVSTKQATSEPKTLPTANPGEPSDRGEKAPAIEKNQKQSMRRLNLQKKTFITHDVI